MPDIDLRPFSAGDVDWLVDRHAYLYARDEGFDETFGPLVARVLAGFVKTHDKTREAGWIAHQGTHRIGSLFCVADSAKAARLRLFLVLPGLRGQGLGKRLLNTSIIFARQTGYQDLVVSTYKSHTAACALYNSFGFELETEKPARAFGCDLVEQSWRIGL